MQSQHQGERRQILKAAAGAGLTTLAGSAIAQAFEFKPNQRYPDPSVQILDPSFTKYRIYSSTVEQVATGTDSRSTGMATCGAAGAATALLMRNRPMSAVAKYFSCAASRKILTA